MKAVEVENFEEMVIPWRTRPMWRAANATVVYLIRRHSKKLAGASRKAEGIRSRLAPVNDALDELCRETCIWCPDPCCLSADVRYDLRDLLFLHLTDQSIPAGQPRPTPDKPCCYIGPNGCRLPRLSRPWICTWYLCPVQKRRLLWDDSDLLIRLQSSIASVQQLRKELELSFIRAQVDMPVSPPALFALNL